MSKRGISIEEFKKYLNTRSPSGPQMTEILRGIGDGHMKDGILTIAEYYETEGLKSGKRNGFVIGSLLTLGVGSAIFLAPKGVKFIWEKISENKAHDEMGKKIRASITEEIDDIPAADDNEDDDENLI